MLFRRIKARSLPQQLLSYLAEIIIIFLGITISFLFEQWREDKRQEKELIELSESLVTDIEELKVKLKNDLWGSNDWISHLDSLRVQRFSGKISEQQVEWFYRMITGQNYFLFDPYSPTYMSAVSSGVIHEFPDSIKNQLYNVYRLQLPLFQLLYNQQQESITGFRNTTWLQANDYLYQPDISRLSKDVNILRKEIQRPVYGNFINQIILVEWEVYRLNEGTFTMLTEVQGSLQKYIHAHKK